tara:strand:+ start:410 stop:595 length:186 start_codon:yes stop_codon:yes gene_type:complete
VSEPPIELMYKPPGASEHINITEALDEIILTLRELEERMTIVEEFCDQVAHLENEIYGGTD